MVDEKDTQPRRQPTQARSRAMVDALLEATARVLVEAGPDGLTTNRVAEVAGASIGSLYQYFPTREALVAGLVERELERDLAQVDTLLAACAELPLEDLTALLMQGMIASTLARSALHQALLPLVETVHRDRLVLRQRSHLTARLVELALSRRPELAEHLRDAPRERIETAVFLAARAMEQAFNAVKIERPELLADPELARDLVRIVHTVLL